MDVDGSVWQPQGSGHLSEANRCGQGGSFQIIPDKGASDGENAQWHTITPPTIGITGAWTPVNTVLVQPPGSQYGYAASFFWDGGSQSIPAEGNCCGGMDYGLGINRNDLNNSRYFGFQVTCIDSGGCGTPSAQLLDVRGLQLTAQDNTPPTLATFGAANLWHEAEANHWVRGFWPFDFSAADDSGVCSMSETIGGQTIQGPSSTLNQASWTQCQTPASMNPTIDTSAYPDGSLSLQLTAADAASPANVSTRTTAVEVDNAPVYAWLSGPTDALATAGPQSVLVNGAAGPSGVRDLVCSVDGAPSATFAGGHTSISVSGIGRHTIQCYAENNAIDATGAYARSATATWSLMIRQPTAAAITFGTRLVDALRCGTVTVRQHLPARWVVVRIRGQRVHVHLPAVTRRHRRVRCRPRVVVRRIRVGKRVERRHVVLLPHRVQISVKRVAYGRAAGVAGWVGLSNGTALPDVTVQVMTALDNGRNRWRPVALATTNASGFWQARLRPGPSRLVTAVYGGSAETEPAQASAVTLVSGTRVSLRIRPRVTQWGHTIQISGRVLGGQIPSGKLLRLRIGTEGIHATVGIPDINRRGYYRTTWTFAPGRGAVRYWFSVSTLPEADYPYAQTSSRRVYVTVSG